jgi:hypothetical protein
VAETEKMAELVGEDGFKVVGFGMGGKSCRRGERGVGIAGIADIGIEDLPRFGGDGGSGAVRRSAFTFASV